MDDAYDVFICRRTSLSSKIVQITGTSLEVAWKLGMNAQYMYIGCNAECTDECNLLNEIQQPSSYTRDPNNTILKIDRKSY